MHLPFILSAIMSAVNIYIDGHHYYPPVARYWRRFGSIALCQARPAALILLILIS